MCPKHWVEEAVIPKSTAGQALPPQRKRPTSVAVTSAGSATFIEGEPGTFTVTTDAQSGPTISLTKIGRLAPGVRFKQNRDGTATISGTPQAGSAGLYTIVISASIGTRTAPTHSAFTLVVRKAATKSKSTKRRKATPFIRARAKKASKK